jgi:general secretion pathway protein B
MPAVAPPAAAIPPATRTPAVQVPDITAAPAVVPENPALPPTPAAVVAEPAATRREVAAEAPPADGRVVSIEELPASVRKQLGSFAVSGHVWSEEPELRLLTIKDRIVREGGEAEPGVRLEEITQTGAVFTVQGWRFRTGF